MISTSFVVSATCSLFWLGPICSPLAQSIVYSFIRPSIYISIHPSTYRFIHLSILCPFHIYPFIGLCLSQRSPVICGVMRLRLSLFFFLLYLFIIFGLGLPAYICNHNPFLRESVYKFIHQ